MRTSPCVIETVGLPAVEVAHGHTDHEESLPDGKHEHFLAGAQIEALVVGLHEEVSHDGGEVKENAVVDFDRIDLASSIGRAILNMLGKALTRSGGVGRELNQLLQVAVEHVQVVESQGDDGVLDFSVDLVFLLEDEDHDEVYAQQSLLDFFGNSFGHSTQIEQERTLLDQKQYVDQFVPVGQRDETILNQTLLLSQEVGDDHPHYGHHQGLVK